MSLQTRETSFSKGPYPGCREALREAFRSTGIPENAITTLENSLSENTVKQYNVTLKLWWKYCNINNISPFVGEISHVISFLQNIFDNTNNIFGSFNSHRAALSLITSKNLGENLQLKRFLKGIFRLRPPKPKYDCTWEPQQVLTFLKNSEDTSLKFLSSKLVTLIALATGQRLQTISLIRCQNITFSVSGAKIRIPDLIKTSRPNSFQPCLDLPYFVHDSRLCAALTLKQYLERTQPLRKMSSNKLFLTYRKPHGPASKQTLSRWIKEILSSAGVDPASFGAHSTRHASTSAALRKGLHIDLIRKSAGWSSKSCTFAKFYNRPLLEANNFLETVLNS